VGTDAIRWVDIIDCPAKWSGKREEGRGREAGWRVSPKPEPAISFNLKLSEDNNVQLTGRSL
jgi:hypothetical protein